MYYATYGIKGEKELTIVSIAFKKEKSFECLIIQGLLCKGSAWKYPGTGIVTVDISTPRCRYFVADLGKESNTSYRRARPFPCQKWFCFLCAWGKTEPRTKVSTGRKQKLWERGRTYARCRGAESSRELGCRSTEVSAVLHFARASQSLPNPEPDKRAARTQRTGHPIPPAS